MEAELQDWELLQNTDDDFDFDFEREDEDDVVVTAPVEEFDESENGIRSDYFALDSNYNNNNNNNNRGYAVNTTTSVIITPQEEEGEESVDDQGSVQSDNPSWLDPSSHNFETSKGPGGGGGEFWSDTASDGSSVSRKFEGLEECKHELGFVDDANSEVGSQGNDEKIVGSGEFLSDSVKFGSVDGGIEDDLGVSAESGDGGGEGRSGELGSDEGTPEEIGSLSAQVVSSGEGGGDKRGVNVWWKLPLELLRFCVFRVSPVWSVSIAAAVVGFVILKRRLYRMKHKTQRIALNVTLEDKKVSQFMARAARLNEAFSVVKRVPMIRPTVPAAGLTPWPVMSLR